MTAYAYNAAGWFAGEVDDDAPDSTPIEPPEYGPAFEFGVPWPRWHRFEWRLEEYPAPPAPAVPDEVEMWRARCALIATGKLQAVLDAIAAIEDPVQKALVAAQFEFRPTVRRISPLTQQLQQLAGITDEERDEMFVLAASL